MSELKLLIYNFNLGYTGDDCSIDIDECLDLNVQCGHRGECKNIPGSFSCLCEKEFCGQYCDLRNPCFPVCYFNFFFLSYYNY